MQEWNYERNRFDEQWEQTELAAQKNHRLVRRVVVVAMLVLTLIAGFCIYFLGTAVNAWGAPVCRAIDHRGTSHAADNTLEGQAWDAAHHVRTEGDLMALYGLGTVWFHQKDFNQGTNGEGPPSTRRSVYADSLVLDTGEQVPLGIQVFRQARANHGKLLVELHFWPDGWTRAHLASVVAAVRHLGLQKQIAFTGTRPALATLASLAPRFQAIKRIKHGEVFTRDQAETLSVDGIQVPAGLLTAGQVRVWRRSGYTVWGHASLPSGWPAFLRSGIGTVQTNSPGAFLSTCRSWR